MVSVKTELVEYKPYDDHSGISTYVHACIVYHSAITLWFYELIWTRGVHIY